SKHGDRGSLGKLDGLKRQLLPRPLEGRYIDRLTGITVGKAQVVALLPACSRKRVGIEDGFAIGLKPGPGVLQRLNRFGMEEPGGVRSDTNHEVASFSDCIHEVANDPGTLFIIGAVGLVTPNALSR